MIGDPTVAVLDTLNEVFPSSSIDTKVEELGVCITLLNVSNAGTLLLFACKAQRKHTLVILQIYTVLAASDSGACLNIS
jgi:hypothetical protein